MGLTEILHSPSLMLNPMWVRAAEIVE